MIYFDHNATTPMLPEARQAWLEATERFIGNPSSPHRIGSRADTAITGEVIRVDRFDNLVTNIDNKLFDKFSQSGAIEVFAGPHRIGRVVATYAEAPGGEACALFGSTDHLEIAVNAASAAERLNLTRGATVTVKKT